jgi:hypothetical protein
MHASILGIKETHKRFTSIYGRRFGYILSLEKRWGGSSSLRKKQGSQSAILSTEDAVKG